jgi:hypothetical protein
MKRAWQVFEDWAFGGFTPHSSIEKLILWNDLHGHLRYFDSKERIADSLTEMYNIFEQHRLQGRVNDGDDNTSW